MNNFGKFTPYTPDSPDTPLFIEGQSVMYLRDDKGNDWYKVRDLFDENETLKIGYDDNGRVKTFTTNIYAFVPKDLSVVELPATDDNLKVSLGDDWFYKDGMLQQIRDYQAIALAEQGRLMDEATKRIDWLAAAIDDGDASDEEEAELKSLRAYRAALRRLDLSAAPKIIWPEQPASV